MTQSDKDLFLHFYNNLNFHSKNVRNTFRTYLFTSLQSMKPVETMLSEKFEVDERWVLSDVWLKL